MIQSIGFKNFRRFENFPDMELGKVNFLVGPNNSGKSTMAKGLILLLDNLKNLRFYSSSIDQESSSEAPKVLFGFDANQMHNLHIGTFKNALFAGSKNGLITFSMSIDDMDVELDVLGDKESSIVSGEVVRFKLNSKEHGIEIILNFIEHTMTFNVNSVSFKQNDLIELQRNETECTLAISELRKLIAKETNPLLVSVYNQNIAREEAALKNVRSKIKILMSAAQLEGRITDTIPFVVYEYDNSVYSTISRTAHAAIKNLGTKINKDTKTIFDSQLIGQNFDKILKALMKFEEAIKGITVEYIYAHAASQKQVLNSNDKSDYLAQTVHEYAKMNVQKGDPLNSAIIRSIKRYNMGDDYRVSCLEGEAYIVEIHDEFGWSNLANKGMGSIQLFTLALRLNMIEYRNRGVFDSVYIFIEEPEQNLHPEFQSLLVEKFEEMSKKGLYCVVETHSEYIVRQTQYLVSRAKYIDEKDLNEDNPFTVFYFEKNNRDKKNVDTVPYRKIRYNTNGRFIDSFGSGFYDAAGELALKLSKNEIEAASKAEINWDSL